jgi:hypothetical protein
MWMALERPPTGLHMTSRPRPTGAIACVLAMLFLFGAGGCRKDSDRDIEEAVSHISLAAILETPPTAMRDTGAEATVRLRLRQHDADRALSILSAIYENSSELEKRGQALAAAGLLVDASSPENLRVSVHDLACRAMRQPEPLLVFLALRLLYEVSDGSNTDIAAVSGKVQSASVADVAEIGYAVLMKWHAHDFVIAQVAAHPPAETNSEAYEAWRMRTTYAILACAREERWRGGAIPPSLAAALVDNMLRDTHLISPASEVLVALDAKQLAPEMERRIYATLPACDGKVTVALAILLLTPEDSRIRNELPMLIKGRLASTGELAQSAAPLKHSLLWIARVAANSGDDAFAQNVWRSFDAAPSQVRAELLAAMLGAMGSRESMAMGLIGSLSDEQLREMVASSKTLTSVLRLWLFDGVEVVKRQGSALRGATEDRLRGILISLGIK